MPAAEGRISMFDLGFGHCDATYDVAHVWDGQFFQLDAHVDRFLESVEGCQLTLPVDRQGLVELLHDCVGKSGLRDAVAYMIATRGSLPPGVRDLRRCADHTFTVYSIPYLWVLPREKALTGAHLIVSDVPRIPKQCVNPRYKNFHWGDFNQSVFQAFEKGGDSTVLADLDGNIAEGPGFNVFIVKDGAVHTSPDNVLEGITRRTVFELCEDLQLKVRQQYFSADDLRNADEVFISSTAGGIFPIVKIDGRDIGDGRPGSRTVQIGNLYWKKKLDGWHGTPVDYGNG
jgi:branched-chain amino acid aminotransferase